MNLIRAPKSWTIRHPFLIFFGGFIGIFILGIVQCLGQDILMEQVGFNISGNNFDLLPMIIIPAIWVDYLAALFFWLYFAFQNISTALVAGVLLTVRLIGTILFCRELSPFPIAQANEDLRFLIAQSPSLLLLLIFTIWVMKVTQHKPWSEII